MLHYYGAVGGYIVQSLRSLSSDDSMSPNKSWTEGGRIFSCTTFHGFDLYRLYCSSSGTRCIFVWQQKINHWTATRNEKTCQLNCCAGTEVKKIL